MLHDKKDSHNRSNICPRATSEKILVVGIAKMHVSDRTGGDHTDDVTNEWNHAETCEQETDQKAVWESENPECDTYEHSVNKSDQHLATEE